MTLSAIYGYGFYSNDQKHKAKIAKNNPAFAPVKSVGAKIPPIPPAPNVIDVATTLNKIKIINKINVIIILS